MKAVTVPDAPGGRQRELNEHKSGGRKKLRGATGNFFQTHKVERLKQEKTWELPWLQKKFF